MMPAQPYRTRTKFRPRTDRLLTRAVQKDAATVRERTRSKFRTRAVRKDAADAPRRKET